MPFYTVLLAWAGSKLAISVLLLCRRMFYHMLHTFRKILKTIFEPKCDAFDSTNNNQLRALEERQAARSAVCAEVQLEDKLCTTPSQAHSSD
jgi:hypothetical protein